MQEDKSRPTELEKAQEEWASQDGEAPASQRQRKRQNEGLGIKTPSQREPTDGEKNN